jgi:hypothetical protein
MRSRGASIQSGSSNPRHVMKGNEKGAGLLAPGVTIQHTSIATGLTYDDLVRGFERELGRRNWQLLTDC